MADLCWGRSRDGSKMSKWWRGVSRSRVSRVAGVRALWMRQCICLRRVPSASILGGSISSWCSQVSDWCRRVSSIGLQRRVEYWHARPWLRRMRQLRLSTFDESSWLELLIKHPWPLWRPLPIVLCGQRSHLFLNCRLLFNENFGVAGNEHRAHHVGVCALFVGDVFD